MEPKFQVQLKIRKPVTEVFDAVVRPEKLSGYFLQTASGGLAEGATVKWKFAEVAEEFDVVVRNVWSRASASSSNGRRHRAATTPGSR
jgi:uncharacterized protein YndB with AHSA1/START domain